MSKNTSYSLKFASQTFVGKIINKITSRKFIACIAGVATGIALIATGNTATGTASVIASVVGYIAAEGYVDGKAVKNTIEITQDVLDSVLKDFEDAEVGEDDGNGA